MVIYQKEIAQTLRCSKATACRLMRTMKDAFEKKDYQYITITEFCEYTGLKLSEVQKHLQ